MKSATEDEVEAFLRSLHQKLSTFGYVFADRREKNVLTMAELGLRDIDVRKILADLKPCNYYKGPSPDSQCIYPNPLWEFGTQYKKNELYIKITLGCTRSPVVCISLHIPERPIHYPLKAKTQRKK